LNFYDEFFGLNLKQKVEPLLTELITKKVRKKLKGKKVEVIIPENFGQTVYKYSIDEEKAHYDKIGYSNSQGHFVVPMDKKAVDFWIIVNKIAFEELQYFSTIFHEFAHVLDFTDYINVYGNPTMMDRQTKHLNYYFEFYLWAEYNAKKIGLKRLQEEFDKKNWAIDLKTSTTLFIQDVDREIDNLPRLYNLMHYFARITVCDDGLLTLNPEIYPKNYLIENFGPNATIIHTTMESINNFDEFEKEKDFIKYLLNW